MTPRERAGSEQVPPTRYPETTPVQYPGSGYDFTLQAVIEMQRTLGEISQSVRDMSGKIEKHEAKLDRISHVIYAAAVVIAIAVSVGAWILNKGADVVIHKINSSQVFENSNTSHSK